jgi:hypothetical protein
MNKRGWHLNGLTDPAAVHIACTVRLFNLFIISINFLGLRLLSSTAVSDPEQPTCSVLRVKEDADGREKMRLYSYRDPQAYRAHYRHFSHIAFDGPACRPIHSRP